MMSAEQGIRATLARIDAAWRNKQFDGLDECFHERATIVRPGYVVHACGRDKCAESYREFATNEGGPRKEQGTDQLILQQCQEGWQVVWRYIHFQPAE
ncbi:MAG: hypothetical protein HYR49_04380 [Gammaproteobacteria bacterium]|nr:hypothetical protein [Gammaproteobacteria bacterium]